LARAALNSKDLSLDPLAAKTAANLLCLSDEMRNILAQYTPSDNNSFLATAHRLRVKYLAPGDSLWGTGTVLLEALSSLINSIGQDWEPLDLHKWLSDGLVFGTSSALYGPGNPLRQDPSLIEDMWYESSPPNCINDTNYV
jgi:hypothetical protein